MPEHDLPDLGGVLAATLAARRKAVDPLLQQLQLGDFDFHGGSLRPENQGVTTGFGWFGEDLPSSRRLGLEFEPKFG